MLTCVPDHSRAIDSLVSRLPIVSGAIFGSFEDQHEHGCLDGTRLAGAGLGKVQ